MTNSADSDQLASSTDLDLHCKKQWQGISGYSRNKVKKHALLCTASDKAFFFIIFLTSLLSLYCGLMPVRGKMFLMSTHNIHVHEEI